MSEYYFISQLPSLDGISENIPLPITQERFLELCDRFLSDKAKREISNLTLVPSKEAEKSSSALINEWCESERNLRFALAKVRADKMKKAQETQKNLIPIELTKVANTAIEMESPLEAEKFLNHYRLQFLETLRPMDNFSDDFVFYYGLKLKLLLHIRLFDEKIGENAYKNIYNSILDGDRVEAI